MKKKWNKPHLYVLCRSNPEETVLVVCKQTGTAIYSSNWNTGCRGSHPIQTCYDCQFFGAS